MPTPIEILLDPISLIILGIYGSLMLWEAIFPARKLPEIKFWKLKGIAIFTFFFFLSSYLPLFVDPILAPYQLFDLSILGTIGGALAGIIVYQIVGYFYHRSMHKFDGLWKSFHQMHHSSERLDTYSAFFFSPLDMIGWTMVGSISLVLFVGLAPQAITIIILGLNFLAIFQHSNIKTPRWLGYIIQRPESHALHHGRGLHKYNYADLPLIDMIFGTFKNPKSFERETGFYDGASNRIFDMLLFKDVSTPPVSENDFEDLMPKEQYFFNKEERIN